MLTVVSLTLPHIYSGFILATLTQANPAKFQMITLGEDSSDINFGIDNNTVIKLVKEVKLLGITIDDTLYFYPHVKRICG